VVDSLEGGKVSSLLRKLLPEAHDLEQRISSAKKGPEALSSGPTLIRGTSAWEGVKAVIDRALDEKRPVLVYGDYDVDGVTSTYLLFRWLRSHGVPGNCFIPSRLQHGYGLDEKVIAQASEQGYKTLIALDCGTANLAELEMAVDAGLDCAVIDHHEPKDTLPPVPVLNHHLEDNLEEYCTAGLVYHVLKTLRDDHGDSDPGDELELVGLATIADVVPLSPGNWLLAHLGLKALPETLNPGLAELIKVSKLHGLTRVTGRQASFNLIPRLNAPGRMKSAALMLKLLQAADQSAGREAAYVLENLNTERKKLSEQTTRAALLQSAAFEGEAAVALYDKNWHPGILGIVAARVAETAGKPAVILTDAPGSEGQLTGSVRSANGHDVVKALAGCTGSTISFGGHSAAAGVKLEAGKLEEFRSEWSNAVKAQAGPGEEAGDSEHAGLVEVGLGELTQQFEDEVWQLEPFGNGFPPLRCILKGCRVDRLSYMGKDKTHLNLQVTDGTRQVRLVGFNQSHLYHRLSPGQPLEPIVEIEPDNWNNRYSIMLRLLGLREDYAPQGSGQ